MSEALAALIIGTLLLVGSPGPAPLALAATSASFGIRSGIPFYLGNLLGLAFALVSASAGMAALFTAFPSAELALKILGGVYICYLALKIATASTGPANVASAGAPKIRDGILLSVLNPKGYAAFLAIFSNFLLPISPTGLALVVTGLVCLVVTAAVDLGWLCLGSLIGPLMRAPGKSRAIRVGFGVMMVAAVLWAFTQ
ncbi:LysE family translocator [Algiphilus aromaticivorans]|uniref:LysE family translocator n=1 Tax=Algiphilus aromaticivorans TaxID=382454 RepID=UPI0005C14AB9|nr:LysE family translocator [Algiphilus aromaticivorans]